MNWRVHEWNRSINRHWDEFRLVYLVMQQSIQSLLVIEEKKRKKKKKDSRSKKDGRSV